MIELINKDKRTGRITFQIKGTTPAFVNALRRIMVDAVPTMAIEDLEVVQNGSALYDEIIAHRLGLVPLVTDLKGYDVKEEGDELSAKNSVKLTLVAKGPCTVYAGDLKSKDPKIKPAQPKTPIVKLLKGQELELEATAILGRGKQHAKFTPCLAWYTYKPKVTVNNGHKDFDSFKDKYPPQVFNGDKIDAKLIEKHDLFEACDGVNKDIVNVEHDSTTFIFNIEPWGQLTPAEILASAADHFSGLVDEFTQSISK